MLGGRYALGRLLGSGALGAVFVARDGELDREVAVKLLRASPRDSPDALRRLIREANAMARLNHDHVVKVFDVGRYHDLNVKGLPVGGVSPHGAFVVMELVVGQDLQQWLQTKRPQATVLEVFDQAARGLAAAHAEDIVHRDFKPANVLLSDGGIAKVTDFGLAAAFAPGASEPNPSMEGDGAPASNDARASAWKVDSLTGTGFVMGTPAYMAPEQHRGGKVGTRADQYAFCVALAEALYGRRPVRGSSLDELLKAKLSVRLPPDRGISRRLRRALGRGLAADPTDRFATMDDLRARLHPSSRRIQVAGGLAVTGVVLVAAVSWWSRADVPPRGDAGPGASPPAAEPGAGEWRGPDRVAFVDRPRVSSDRPAQRRAIRAAIERLSDDGRDDPAERSRTIEALVAQAQALGDAGLVAEVQVLHALDLHETGDQEAAQVAADSAFRLAETSDEHEVAARAATVLMGLQPTTTDAWRRWAALAEVHASLSFREPSSEIEVERELAFALQQRGDVEAALPHWQRVAALSEEFRGPQHLETASALSMLGSAYIALGNPAEARALLLRALDIVELTEPVDPLMVVPLRLELAVALMHEEDWVGATNELQAIWVPLSEVGDSSYLRGRQGTVRWHLARIVAHHGRHEEAIPYFEESLALIRPDRLQNRLALHHAMARSLLEVGRRDEAIASLRTGLKFTDTDAPEWDERVKARELLARLEGEPGAR